MLAQSPFSLKMNLDLILLVLVCIQGMNTKVMRMDFVLLTCTESDLEFLTENDGDELKYADFKEKKLVMTLPDFADPFGTFPFDVLIPYIDSCKHNLAISTIAYKNPPEAVDPPQSSIYPEDDVLLGSENTLICHVTGFFPPPVNVSWTKNNMDVTDKAVFSHYFPNEDGTYNMFSHMSFTPQEGDIYSCTVNHKSLQSPDTRTWEVDAELHSVGPSVFCGVGLTAGLLGVATGTFFLTKTLKCN